MSHARGVRPIVLVHGIWDSARRIAPLARGLRRRGFTHVHAVDLIPPWGNARLEVLAEQLRTFVANVQQEHGVDKVDLVGFSMGALVSRAYLALLDGKHHVRTFVSMAAPHQGTLMAYLLPLPGVKQMRPNSPFLRALGEGCEPLGDVNVHCIYTPFDLSIVPGRSGCLKGARSTHVVPVLVHRWMLSDGRVADLVASLLREEHSRTPLSA